jgi:ankyrin repeat protein
MSNATSGSPDSRLPPVSEVFADERLRRAAAAAEGGDPAQTRATILGDAPTTKAPVELDAVQPSGVNLLMYEIVARNETAVRTLLDAGADPNALTPEGASPMLVAGTAQDPRWLGLLLDSGGDPDLKNQFGEPLLTSLVPYGRWETMLFLLDRGAKIDATGPSGQTAMFRLGSLHQFDRVYAMLDRGADPALADAHGLTLSSFVVQRVPPDSPQQPWQKRVAERLGLGDKRLGD